MGWNHQLENLVLKFHMFHVFAGNMLVYSSPDPHYFMIFEIREGGVGSVYQTKIGGQTGKPQKTWYLGCLGGGNSNIFWCSSRKVGEIESNLTCAYFFKWVVHQPPTRWCFWENCHFFIKVTWQIFEVPYTQTAPFDLSGFSNVTTKSSTFSRGPKVCIGYKNCCFVANLGNCHWSCCPSDWEFIDLRGHFTRPKKTHADIWTLLCDGNVVCVFFWNDSIFGCKVFAYQDRCQSPSFNKAR